MALRLKGSSSGYAEIDASADAGSVTLTLPATAGTINVKDASGNTSVGTGVNLGNPGPNIFTINTNGSERFRIAADGAVNISGVLTYEDVTSVDAIGLSTFRDGLNTKDVGITTISTSKSDTATDIFVYDTSKDSDGGAWRKRTKHTSWYNETASATRGSRKEFPAVAVIVAEATKVTIYDGDDPDLPLWMAFNLLGSVGGNSNMLPRGGSGTESDVTSIACLNGRLVVGLKDVSGTVGEGLIVIDFISELARVHRTEGSGYTGAIYGSPISGRNSNGVYYGDYNSLAIVAETCNDVAMTVLPNAPIDDATGLPVPTIAVATDGGVSVIKDDGVVVDMSEVDVNWISNLVEFFNGKLIHNDHLTGSNNEDYLIVSEIPTSDTNYLGGGVNYNHASTPAINYSRTHDNTDLVSLDNNVFAFGVVDSTDHLTLVSDETPQSQSMVAFATTSFNTGWMHGDIKGAFLSDTDTTNTAVAYSDGFSNNDKGWAFADNGSSTISGGNLILEQNGNARAYDVDALDGIATGTKLVFTFTVGGSGTGSVLIDDDGAGAGVGGNTNYGSFSSTGSYMFTATKTASNRIRFFRQNGSNNYEFAFLNITTEYDRSANDKGLTSNGTVNKSVVATGADLVGYGPFSNANYLKQLYNSDLAPGTAAYSVSCWFKTGTSSTDQYIFDRNNGGGSNTSRHLLLISRTGAGTPNTFQFWHRDASGNVTSIDITDKVVTDNSWHQVVALNDGTNYRVYVDGEVSSVTSSQIRNVGNDNNPPMYIGVRHTEESPMTGYMALFRYSLSAPSPEQIKKMYEDEKVLFQENAKATLYGSSDAVTALAYDEVTDQLHVGTASGRSDFQGLRRINNTTTAVTTATSAHDTFIIEQ